MMMIQTSSTPKHTHTLKHPHQNTHTLKHPSNIIIVIIAIIIVTMIIIIIITINVITIIFPIFYVLNSSYNFCCGII